MPAAPIALLSAGQAKTLPGAARQTASHAVSHYLLHLEVNGLGLLRKRHDFPLRCDDPLVHISLLRAGLGVGGMRSAIADPLIEPVAPFITLPTLPVWLTAPEALRQNPRIRSVMAHLARAFRSHHAAPALTKV